MDCPSDQRRGQGKAVAVIGLQKDALRAHQSLAHRAQRCLAEIPAVRVLGVRPAGKQGDSDVGQRRACQYAAQPGGSQAVQDRVLPVGFQHLRRTDRVGHDAAAGRQRLQ
ncbi:unknown [Clostridium sp. CAG:448]|nr:unknown [Clostridium sp. CAG:448]